MSTRREFLKQTVASAALSALGTSAEATVPPTSAAAPPPTSQIEVFVTDATRRHQVGESLKWNESPTPASANAVVVDPSARFQPVLGFGGAFTDASCYVFHQLPEPARQELLNDLFNPREMAFTVCRTCIGSSDYSRSVFSYDEGPADPDLARFSIAHDREYIIPTLLAARRTNPDLFLLSSPWSPPGWMKDNQSMLGGTISRRLLKTYANYIVQFLRSYQNEGVEINAVTPQNEVDTDQDSRMPACLFPQEIEVEYVSRGLGPAIESAQLKTKVWLIDHNYNLWGRAIAELDDPQVSKVTKSIAWHGYVGQPEWVQKVIAAHPDAEMYWTEGGPDITDPKYQLDWTHWSRTFAGILRNHMRCIIAWNLALDEQGKPNVGPFPCGGVVTVHSGTGEITRSGQYWAFAHYSRHIRRNAIVIGSQGTIDGIAHVAATNPDGSYVVVLTNTGATQKNVEIRFGKSAAQASLQPDSIATLTWSA
jgi:glucosylceramidase